MTEIFMPLVAALLGMIMHQNDPVPTDPAIASKVKPTCSITLDLRPGHHT